MSDQHTQSGEDCASLDGHDCTCSPEWIEKCTAPDGTTCHCCGQPAEWRSPFNAVVWCFPCKFGACIPGDHPAAPQPAPAPPSGTDGDAGEGEAGSDG